MDTLLICMLMVSVAAGASRSASRSGHCGMRFPPHRKGYCFSSSVCPGAVLASSCNQESDRTGCCVLEYTSLLARIQSNITIDMFKSIFGDTRRSKGLFLNFVHSLKTAQVVTCHQQSAYITQIAFDTNYLSIMEEAPLIQDASNKSAWKYIGRGGIHISGKSYYKWLQTKINRFILEMPELLAFPSLSFHSAAITWSNSYSSASKKPLSTVSYNQLADGSRYGLLLLSYYLRGNIRNADRLLKVWAKVNKVLDCDCKARDEPQCIVGGQTGRCKMVSECIGKQVESAVQCMGPPNAVRCSLGSNHSVQVDVFVEKRKNGTYPRIVQDSLKLLERVAIASGGKVSYGTSSKSNFPLDVDWSRKKRHLTVFVQGTKGQNSFALQKMNQSSGLIFLKFRGNHNVDLTYGHFNRKVSIDANDLEERLQDKMYSGPWFLPTKRKMIITLERLENILLAIDLKNGSTFDSIIHLQMLEGNISIEGVHRMHALPWHKKDCKSSQHYEDPPLLQRVSVEYQSSKGRQQMAITTMVLNAKAIISLRGLNNISTSEIRVEMRERPSVAQKHQGNNRPMIVTAGYLAIIASCSVALVFLCTLICVVKQHPVNVGSKIDVDTDNSTPVVIRSCGEQQNHNPENLLGSSDYRSDGDAELYSTRAEVLLKQIVALKIFFVLLYNLPVVISRSSSNSVSTTRLVDYTLRYFSNLVYGLLLVEINCANKSCLDKITNSKKRRKYLLYALLWGIPALVSSIPSVLWLTLGQSWKWTSVNIVIEVSTKSILFAVALILSLKRLFMRLSSKDSIKHWQKDVFPLLFNIFFTTAWLMSTIEMQLSQNQWFNRCHSLVNFILAIFICTSVYWQTRKSLLAMKQSRLREKAEIYEEEN